MSLNFYKTNLLIFQITSHWSGVSSVHVDDFLRCGTDQMLLVLKNQCETGLLLDRFFLTDLCGISYSVSHHCSISWSRMVSQMSTYLTKCKCDRSHRDIFSVARTAEHRRNLIHHQRTTSSLFKHYSPDCR